MKKRILSLLLALLMLLSMVPVSAIAEGNVDYYANKEKKARFLYDLNVSAAPEQEVDWSAATQVPLTDVSDLVVIIDDCKILVEQDEVWYKVRAQEGETLPEALQDMWIFHDTYSTSLGATIEFACGICDQFGCTSAHENWCEICKKDDCGEDHTATEPTEPEPTDPSEPDNSCACCESCTGAEGCQCLCGGCDFCQPEEEPELPTLTHPTGVEVTAESFPEGVSLTVQEVSVSSQLNKYEISESKLVFGLDISIINTDSSAYQPGGALVKVPVSAPAGTSIGIIHDHNGNISFMGVTKVLPDGTVEFYTDSFSTFAGFTVDFHYNGVDFSIEGLTSILLSDLFTAMGIEEDAYAAKSVVFSDNTLVGVAQQDDGNWLLTSLEAFSTNETLIITFNDDRTIVIDVTDVMYFEGVHGQTYNVPYWNLDSEGVLNIAINYDNVPMTIYLYKESVASLSWNIVSGGSYIDTSGSRTLTVNIKNNIPIQYNAVDIDLNPGGRVHLDVYRYIDITYNNGGKNAANMPTSVVDTKITTSTNNYTVSSTVPTVPGYSFSHWSGSNGKTYKAGETASLTSNTTLTAVWTANTNTRYTIETYTQNLADSNYTKTTETKTGTTNTAVTLTPSAPTGFTYNANKSTVSGTIAGDGSLVLKVYYDRNSYTVTTNKGTGISAVSGAGTYKYGASVSINATLQDGYSWNNWTGYNTQSTKNHSFTMPASNVNYTANATANAYQVQFNGNGATGGSMSNQSFTFGTAQNLTANGYTRVYTVTYDANGGTVNTTADNTTATATFNGWEDRGSIVYKGTTYAYTTFDAPYYANPNKSNDVFVHANFGNGHYNKYGLLDHYVNHGKAEYEKGSTTRKPAPTGDEAPGLYPNQAKVSNLATTNGYTVPLYANWTLGSVTLPEPSRDGYAFQHWTDGTNTYAAGATYTPTANVTLTAQWEVNEYTATFNYNSGDEGVATKNFTVESALTLPKLTKTGYTGKWIVTKVEGNWTNGAEFASEGSVAAGKYGNVTFTAQWRPITYKIQFTGGEGGQGSMTEITATYDKDETLPENEFQRIIKVTYDVYGGKNLDPDDASVSLEADFNGWLSGNKTYADKASVKNLASTQDAVVQMTAQWNLKSTTTPTVEKDGYTFEGWMEKDVAAGTAISAGGTYTPTRDTTLVAQWKAVDYTITYDLKGGAWPSDAAHPGTYKVTDTLNITNPTRTGWKFTGWTATATSAEENWDESYTGIQNLTGRYGSVTLTANWVEQYRYVLKFDANGGENAPQTMTVDWCDVSSHTFGWSGTPTRNGYTFLGWAESATSQDNVAGSSHNTYSVPGTKTETVEKTLYAIWQRDTGSLKLDYTGDGAPVIVTVTCTQAVNESEKITITMVIDKDTTVVNLPTGTYAVTAESGNAAYTASVKTIPNNPTIENNQTAVVEITTGSKGLNWFTAFFRVKNKCS